MKIIQTKNTLASDKWNAQACPRVLVSSDNEDEKKYLVTLYKLNLLLLHLTFIFFNKQRRKTVWLEHKLLIVILDIQSNGFSSKINKMHKKILHIYYAKWRKVSRYFIILLCKKNYLNLNKKLKKIRQKSK